MSLTDTGNANEVAALAAELVDAPSLPHPLTLLLKDVNDGAYLLQKARSLIPRPTRTHIFS